MKIKENILCALLIALALCFTSCIFSQQEIESVTAYPGNGFVILEWQKSSYATASTDYLQVDDESLKKISSGSTNGYVTGLTNGKTYTFTILNYDDNGDVYSSQSTIATPSESYEQSYTYSSSTPYVELNDNMLSIKLTGVADKSIVFANVNTSDVAVDKDDARYVFSTTLNTSNNVASEASSSVRACAVGTDSFYVENKISLPEESFGIKNFVPPADYKVDKEECARFASRESSTYTDNFDVSSPVVDSSYRYVYLDQNTNLDSYAKEKVTLRAIGKDSSSNTICLLWVAEDNFSSTTSSSGKTINSSVAQSLATTFAEHYANETSVFGSESNYFADSYQSLPLSRNSPTKEYVNIVVCDIGKDYGLSYSKQCDFVGYFHPKDYYLQSDEALNASKYSNNGKYFYIDAPFCNMSGSNSNGYEYRGVIENGLNVPSDTVISTLFHEFQHMINFNQKNIKLQITKKGEPQTWYNEMLSMLAEDMMQDQLGLKPDEAPRGARLPTFNQYYYSSGIVDYLDESDAVISYSTSYAFGAWLSRNYGGPELVSKISQNSYVDMDSVVEAVKSITGSNVTASSLLKEYVKACVYRTSFASSNNLSTFNKDAGGEITAGGYTSQMTAINLFSSDYKYTVKVADSNSSTKSNITYYGPCIYGQSQFTEIRPYGFFLHSVTNADNLDSITLYFTPRHSSGNDNIVIYVQDKFDTTKAY